MIIQSAPEGRNDSRRFVISLEEHLELVGQLAENFGNDTFEKPEPRNEFLYACRWHDRGWRDLDLNPALNPETGLPYNLVDHSPAVSAKPSSPCNRRGATAAGSGTTVACMSTVTSSARNCDA